MKNLFRKKKEDDKKAKRKIEQPPSKEAEEANFGRESIEAAVKRIQAEKRKAAERTRRERLRRDDEEEEHEEEDDVVDRKSEAKMEEELNGRGASANTAKSQSERTEETEDDARKRNDERRSIIEEEREEGKADSKTDYRVCPGSENASHTFRLPEVVVQTSPGDRRSRVVYVPTRGDDATLPIEPYLPPRTVFAPAEKSTFMQADVPIDTSYVWTEPPRQFETVNEEPESAVASRDNIGEDGTFSNRGPPQDGGNAVPGHYDNGNGARDEYRDLDLDAPNFVGPPDAAAAPGEQPWHWTNERSRHAYDGVSHPMQTANEATPRAVQPDWHRSAIDRAPEVARRHHSEGVDYYNGAPRAAEYDVAHDHPVNEYVSPRHDDPMTAAVPADVYSSLRSIGHQRRRLPLWDAPPRDRASIAGYSNAPTVPPVPPTFRRPHYYSSLDRYARRHARYNSAYVAPRSAPYTYSSALELAESSRRLLASPRNPRHWKPPPQAGYESARGIWVDVDARSPYARSDCSESSFYVTSGGKVYRADSKTSLARHVPGGHVPGGHVPGGHVPGGHVLHTGKWPGSATARDGGRKHYVIGELPVQAGASEKLRAEKRKKKREEAEKKRKETAAERREVGAKLCRHLPLLLSWLALGAAQCLPWPTLQLTASASSVDVATIRNVMTSGGGAGVLGATFAALLLRLLASWNDSMVSLALVLLSVSCAIFPWTSGLALLLPVAISGFAQAMLTTVTLSLVFRLFATPVGRGVALTSLFAALSLGSAGSVQICAFFGTTSAAPERHHNGSVYQMVPPHQFPFHITALLTFVVAAVFLATFAYALRRSRATTVVVSTRLPCSRVLLDHAGCSARFVLALLLFFVLPVLVDRIFGHLLYFLVRPEVLQRDGSAMHWFHFRSQSDGGGDAERDALLLQTAYWLSSFGSRLLACALLVCVPVSVYLIAGTTVTSVACAVLLAYADQHEVFRWILVPLIGAGNALLFPCGLTWANAYLRAWPGLLVAVLLYCVTDSVASFCCLLLLDTFSTKTLLYVAGAVCGLEFLCLVALLPKLVPAKLRSRTDEPT